MSPQKMTIIKVQTTSARKVSHMNIKRLTHAVVAVTIVAGCLNEVQATYIGRSDLDTAGAVISI